ncbi:MAG: DUF3877 family protein [Eubacteriales bacterium]|nr:DUF3877 family protein [Eubacteriales bacterium]
MSDFNFSRLRANIIDVMTEQQLKLGYLREKVRLYYPLDSLCHLMNCTATAAEMEVILERFAVAMKEEWGLLTVGRQKDRFCLTLCELAVEWVHRRLDPTAFWPRFIHLMAGGHVSMNEVRALFRETSDSAVNERVDHGEFDELLYFADGRPDDYRYCFKQEGRHLIYHRFVREDYEQLNRAIREE